MTIETNNVALVQQLLECGASWTDPDEYGNTPLSLIIATKDGNAALVKKLLVNGANAKDRDKDGLTPLHVAANLGFNELCAVLVDNGADQGGNTPVVLATQKYHTTAVSILIASGASLRWSHSSSCCSKTGLL